MRYGRVTLLLTFLTATTVAAQTVTGKFEVSDPRNAFGQGASVSFDSSNASFSAAATVNTSGQINAAVVSAAPAAESGKVWFVSMSTTRSGGLTTGSSVVDGTALITDVGVRINGVDQICGGGAGTLNIDNLTPNTAATRNEDRISNIKGNFQVDCFNADASISGSFEYVVTPVDDGGDGGGGGGGGGVPGGGGGGGTGGGTSGGWFLPPRPTIGGGTGGTPPTTPSAPTPQLIVFPSAETFLGPLPIFSGETITTRITTGINAAFSSSVALSASSDPAGLTFAFSPATIASPGAGTSTLTIGTSPGASAGDYLVFVNAAGGGLFATTSFRVRLECDPPKILGIDQPKSTTIQSGQTARLEVKVAGRGQFNYQWYQGHRGATHTPVQGATGASFTTPALNTTTEFWVRVSNACGSVDSANATVNVTP